MNTETFIQKRDELISKIKELDLYKEYKKLDSLIYEDKIIQELNTKKEKLLQDYKFASEDLQNKILQEILSVQKVHLPHTAYTVSAFLSGHDIHTYGQLKTG